MTHKDLIARAVRWLRAHRYVVILTEPANVSSEVPDAIGFTRSGFSALIECKASRSDFLRDKHKCARRAGSGMGQRRYYLAPPGIILPEELPSDWGLIEATERGSRLQREPSEEHFWRPERARHEVGTLVSHAWRLEHPEIVEPLIVRVRLSKDMCTTMRTWHIRQDAFEAA